MKTAKIMSATRSCTIEINNMSNNYSLINPQFYMYHGSCSQSPQQTIRSRNTGVCAFDKTSNTACGAIGVLTYDLCQMNNQVCTDRIAILFSVPHNYMFYSNIYAVGVFTTDRKCDEALYNIMYYGSGSLTRKKAKEGGITYIAQRVELGATMSNDYNAYINVTITDRLG